MASETPIKNQSAIAWQPAAGSLQAMNLGCMPLGQLGQLLNWRNEQSYTVPDRKPWVDLPLAAESTKPVEAPSPQPVQQPVGPSDVVAAATTTETPTEENALQEAKAQELAAQELAAELAVKAEAEAAAKEAAAAYEAAANTAKKAAIEEATARETAVAKETAAKEAVAKESQEAAARELAAKETAARVVAARVAAAKQAADTKAAAESAPAQLSAPSVPTVAKENKLDVASKRILSTASQREDNRVVDSQPTIARTEPLSLNLNETVPFLPSTHRPPRNESSSDDYLLQLERLVLELNMELGRSRGEPKPVDPMEQMANRIIALNLENLALREKLQRTLNAS
jgi:hypothetical protein